MKQITFSQYQTVKFEAIVKNNGAEFLVVNGHAVAFAKKGKFFKVF